MADNDTVLNTSVAQVHGYGIAPTVLTEADLQEILIGHLVDDNDYLRRSAKTDYNPIYAMDTELLIAFLEETQSESMEHLREVFGNGWESTTLNRINLAIGNRGIVDVLWNGVEIDSDTTLDLVYPRPSAKFDKRAVWEYEANRLSVMDEVWHKPDERIDVVIFLNGIAILTIELKCPASATKWTYQDAIDQYRFERDCETRLLKHRVGALAHFAMDTNEVYVCAKLDGANSAFLPFNKGVRLPGSTHETEPGNPPNPNGFRTSYMWEDILAKDTVFDLLYDFVYEATKRDKRGKVIGRRMIFPRYQQLRAVRRIAGDMASSGTSKNYLVEHSAGSGKTNTIGWLAHKLASLFQPGSNDPLFDKVIIITDRKVVDFQLQEAVLDMAKDVHVVRVMDKDSRSSDLEKALTKSYRIIVTTTQKFLHMKEYGAFAGSGKRFAVLIDEAHGSTEGRSMEAVNSMLGTGDDEGDSTLDELDAFIHNDIALSSKQANISIVGFTATPKGKTLQHFGMLNERGEHEAFDLYSMRQAIEEGFILDVTSNYTTYDVYQHIVKSIADDPTLDSRSARRQIAHISSCDPATIQGKLEIMVDHFSSTVATTLGGRAKAMIVTSGREEAVRYFLAYKAYQEQHRDILGHYGALVAFTGEVSVDGQKYTERGLNGIAEDKLPDAFDGKDYRILIVADKYQTGFDQPLLAAMYVDKMLRGITCVQTLSRLNRMCRPYDKRVFVLDFRNSFDDVMGSFSTFYRTTVLEDPLTISDVRETERRLLGFGVLDPDDIEEYNRILAKSRISHRDQERLFALIDAAAARVKAMDEDDADEVRRVIRNFIKQYAFLLQAAPFEDRGLHMEYNFCLKLINVIDSRGGTTPLDISDKVAIDEFRVTRGETHEGEQIVADPVVRIPRGTGTGLTGDQMERLSQIIADWNARFGLNLDVKIAAGNLLALKGALESDERVRRSALVNSRQEFANTVDDRTEDALVRGYDQDATWYDFLLGNEDARRQLVHAFVDDMYRGLRSMTDETERNPGGR